MSFVVTCAQCREEVLEADRIGDEEECAVRDHVMAVHPNTLQRCSRDAQRVAQELRRYRGAAAGSVDVLQRLPQRQTVGQKGAEWATCGKVRAPNIANYPPAPVWHFARK